MIGLAVFDRYLSSDNARMAIDYKQFSRFSTIPGEGTGSLPNKPGEGTGDFA